jgi:hypothetical protein
MKPVVSSTVPRESDRFIAKAMKDPYYAAVVRRFGAEHLVAAGFFDDGAPLGTDMTIEQDPRLLVTPLGKVQKGLSHHRARGTLGDGPPLVLIASGAFCPVHDGHLEMMEAARREVERRGRIVVGGFLAPDHDGYVGTKCGESALSGAERVRLTQVATAVCG